MGLNIIGPSPVRQTNPELFFRFEEAAFPDFPQYRLILLRGVNFNQQTPQASTMLVSRIPGHWLINKPKCVFQRHKKLKK